MCVQSGRSGKCCVTGHRDIPADKVKYVKDELRREVREAVADGYLHFISGFAEGVDLYFAEAVVELRQENCEIYLEAAIPYRKRFHRLMKDVWSRELLLSCTIIGILAEEYTPECIMARNRYMVGECSRVIAVYDGRDKGGTLQTMRFAHVNERDIREIGI